MRIISIINQKGGCGKTTSAINLAGLTARRGLRTLLVDLDPQSHCAAGLAIPEQRIDLDIGDAMLAGDGDPIDATRLFWRASRNLDLAPSRMKLAGLEAARGGLADRPDKERRLAAVLARFAHSYDACFIDCSPSIGLLTFNALAAATDILIPVETSFFALQGATKQVNTIRSMAKRLGSVAPYWLVATLHDETSALARDLLDELRRRFGKRVAPHVIRRDPTLKEAASFGQPIAEYAPECAGAVDYSALAEWLAEVVGLAPAGSPIAARTGADDAPPTDDPMAEIGALEAKAGLDPQLTPTKVKGFADPQPKTAAPAPREYPERTQAVAIEGPSESAPRGTAGAAVETEKLSPVAELAGRLQHLSTPTTAPADPAEPSRAEELAQRARAMLLRRADEQLRIITGTQPAEALDLAATATMPEPAPLLGSHATLRLIEDPSPSAEPPAAARSESVRQLYGIRTTRSGTLFVQPLSIGQRIAVAGDFTGWMPVPLRRNEQLGVYELCLPLPPGRREYRLVIDGRWMADPFNDHSEPNPFGELNSVFMVEPTPRMHPGAL